MNISFNSCFFLISINLLQAFSQLEIAMQVEMVASVLWRDAVKMIKTVLAGTVTGCFTDVIEAAFGEDEPVELQKVLDEAAEEEEEEEEMEQGASASTSKGGKCKSSTTPSTSSKHKPAHPSHRGLCHLDDAEVYFPTITDKGAYLHAGVDGKFISARKTSKSTPVAGYGCLFSQVSQEEGKKVPDCDFIYTTKGQLSTHICQAHLGICIGCYICDKKWWSSSSWMEHMKKFHSKLGEDAFFVKDGSNISGLIVKEEVTEGDILHFKQSFLFQNLHITTCTV